MRPAPSSPRPANRSLLLGSSTSSPQTPPMCRSASRLTSISSRSTRGLRFDRAAAYGMRLAIPAGSALRFEPGVATDVPLVPIGGAQGGDRLCRTCRRAARCARCERGRARSSRRAGLPRGRVVTDSPSNRHPMASSNTATTTARCLTTTCIPTRSSPTTTPPSTVHRRRSCSPWRHRAGDRDRVRRARSRQRVLGRVRQDGA